MVSKHHLCSTKMRKIRVPRGSTLHLLVIHVTRRPGVGSLCCSGSDVTVKLQQPLLLGSLLRAHFVTYTTTSSQFCLQRWGRQIHEMCTWFFAVLFAWLRNLSAFSLVFLFIACMFLHSFCVVCIVGRVLRWRTPFCWPLALVVPMRVLAVLPCCAAACV